MPPNDLTGWYGKLPVLGDFAGRRLPPQFVEPWDHWLAEGMAHWRASDPGWLDDFLAAPTLHFVIGPGAPFDRSPGYTGVLMPSVDRVGRYFPLTIARPRQVGETEAPLVWLVAMENLAVSALNDDWSVDRLDGELEVNTLEADGGPGWAPDGHSLWWCVRDGQRSSPLLSPGLPTGDDFVRLLSQRPLF